MFLRYKRIILYGKFKNFKRSNIFLCVMLLLFLNKSGWNCRYIPSTSFLLKSSKIIPPSEKTPSTRLPTRSQWTFQSTPDFCKKIVENPRGFTEDCLHKNESKACRDGQYRMFSQYFQDYYLFTRHFSKMKRRGIYVDLAANHPWRISNTYFMDACLGWDGLCIEAHPKYTNLLNKQRSCQVVPKCISNHDGDKMSFVLDGVYSGSTITNKYMRDWQKEGKVLEKVPMTCISLATLFTENLLTRIDYLSLDVEGHEFTILQGINWKKVQIDVLNVELSSNSRRKIHRLLTRRGYEQHIPQLNDESRMTGLLREDAIYIRKGIIFGRPG